MGQNKPLHWSCEAWATIYRKSINFRVPTLFDITYQLTTPIILVKITLVPPDNFLNQYRVCVKHLLLSSFYQATNVLNITTCCMVYGCLHISCTRKLSTGLNRSYQFHHLTYERDASTSLYLLFVWPTAFIAKRKTIYQEIIKKDVI